MKQIAVLGAGMVGSAIALDLSTNFAVTSIDINSINLDEIKKINPAVQTIKFDLNDTAGYKELLKGFDLVVTAVPGFMGYKTIKTVIEAGKDLVDISFFNEDPMTLDELAKKNNVTAIVDCGVAPGMSNLLIGYHNTIMNITTFECMVGGLPKIRTKPFEYKAPFSPIDVIEEYTRPARYIEDGKIVVKPALTDPEYVHFDKVGTLESFNTDGLRSLLFSMGHIPNMKEKTLRYPGHIHLIQALIQSGFFSDTPMMINNTPVTPLEFSSKILINEWKLLKNEEELTVMKIEITGEEKGKNKKITYELYDEFNKDTKTSSMARTTGYTCNAVVHLVADGLFSSKGVFPPEYVGGTSGCLPFVIRYLQQRDVNYRITEESFESE